MTHYESNSHQGYIWIKPKSLIENPLEQSNHIVANT